MKSKVAIAKGVNPQQMAKDALEQSGVAELCRGKQVVIKMNLSGGPSDKRGAVVSQEVTRAVVEHLRPLCRSLALCDGGRPTAAEVKQLFEQKTWAAQLAREMEIELVNLYDGEFVSVPVAHPQAWKRWDIPKAIVDAEVVGSLAVMKVSAAALVTLATKNLFGVIPMEKKYRLHEWIHEIIVDLVQAVKPAFGIIDGYYGWEGGESILGGNAVQTNLVLAGTDLVALDAVGAAVMGFEPQEIAHLQLAHRLGLGTADLSEIEILGATLAEVRRPFARPPAEQLYISNPKRREAGIEAELARV